eukprot:g2456.t1
MKQRTKKKKSKSKVGRPIGESKLQKGQNLSILTGTNTKEIQKELNRYLTSKRIEKIFTGATDSLLLHRPANPVQFVRDYLKNTYPDQCAPVNWTEQNLPIAPLVGGPLEPDSSPELSDGAEDDGGGGDDNDAPARPKWLPKYNMSKRRLAISQCSDDMQMRSYEEQSEPQDCQFDYHGPGYVPTEVESDDEEGGRPGAPADEREMTMDDLIEVVQDKSTGEMLLKFVTRSDSENKLFEERDVRFLMQVEKYKWNALQPSQARYMKERSSEILNEYVLHGGDKQIKLPDKKLRSSTETAAREPGYTTFDDIRRVVLKRVLNGVFTSWIQTFRDADEEDEDSDPEDVDVPDDAVITLLQQIPIFAHLSIEALQEVQSTFELIPVKKKSPIVELGATDDKFFIIAKGRCQVFLPRKKEETEKMLYDREKAKQRALERGDEVSDLQSPILRKILGHLDNTKYKLFEQLGPGDFFGDLGLLYKQQRKALVRAHTDFHCTLWMCSRKKVKRAIIKHAQQERESRAEILSRVEVLKSLSETEIRQLSDDANEEIFNAGEFVVEQGEMANKLIVVRDGGLRIYQNTPDGKRVPLAILKKGMFAGEMALLTKRLSQVDIQAMSDARCLVLTRKQVEFTIGPLLDVVKKRDARRYLRLLQLSM